MKAIAIAPAKIEAVWPHIEFWIAAALKRGRADQTPEEVKSQLQRGGMQLWLAWDKRPHGICITEVLESARGRTCNLVIVAGEGFASWRHLETEIERWAREHWGCVRLTLVGRKGWIRHLKQWNESAVTLERWIDGRD